MQPGRSGVSLTRVSHAVTGPAASSRRGVGVGGAVGLGGDHERPVPDEGPARAEK